MSGSSIHSAEVIHVSFGKASAVCPKQKSAAAARAVDTFAIARGFNARWTLYLHAHFTTPMAVGRAFEVSEKAARNWWDGVSGPKGGYVAAAIALHGGAALEALFDLHAQHEAAA